MGIKDFKIGAWKNPIVNEADRPNRSASNMKEIFDSNTNELRDALNNVIDGLGNGDVEQNFVVATTRDLPESGEKLSTIIGKIRKWFIDLQPAVETIRTDQGTYRYLRGDGTYAVPEAGESANGVPSGGVERQVLVKQSSNDFDATWGTPNDIDAEWKKLLFVDVQVLASMYEKTNTHEDYPYTITIPIDAARDGMLADVHFSQADISRGIFGQTAVAKNGAVEIYADDVFETTIPTIVLWR